MYNNASQMLTYNNLYNIIREKEWKINSLQSFLFLVMINTLLTPLQSKIPYKLLIYRGFSENPSSR